MLPWDLLVGTGAARARGRPDLYDALVARGATSCPRGWRLLRPGRLPRAAPAGARRHGSAAGDRRRRRRRPGPPRRVGGWSLAAGPAGTPSPRPSSTTGRWSGSSRGSRPTWPGRPPPGWRCCADDRRPAGRRSPGSPAGSAGWPRPTPPSVRWRGPRSTQAGDRMRGWAARAAAPSPTRPPRVGAALAADLRRGRGARCSRRRPAATGSWPRSLLYETDALARPGDRRGVRAVRPAGRVRPSRRSTTPPAGPWAAPSPPSRRTPSRSGSWRSRPAGCRGGDSRPTPGSACATTPRREEPTSPRSGSTPPRGGAARSSTAAAACSTGLLTGLPLGAPAVLGLAAFHPTVGDAAADLAGLYGPEGPPQVRPRPDLSVRLGPRPAPGPGRADASPRRDRRPVARTTVPATRARSRCRPCVAPDGRCATSSTSRAPTT